MNQFSQAIIAFFLALTSITIHMNCNKSLLAEIPAYIEIERFYYNNQDENQKPYTQNYHSTKITDAWVTMDGQFLGAFELPCKIPILYEDNHSDSHAFDIYPGIKVNGIAATRLKYPFYQKFEIDTILKLDSTIFLAPTTQYTDQTRVRLDTTGKFEQETDTILTTHTHLNYIEDREDCPTLLNNSNNPIIQGNVVYQGEKSLAIQLDEDNNYFHIRTDTLELKGTTFLELNFKTNTILHVGLIIITPLDITRKKELIRLHTTHEWKKTYLDLTALINEGYSDSEFQVYFEGCNGGNNSISSIYIDNLKLVDYK